MAISIAKSTLLASLGVFGFFFHSADAGASCRNRTDVQAYLCPGDTVFHQDGFEGTVKGVNVFTSEATVLWRASPTRAFMNTRSTHSVSSLAVADGCVEGHCVGDTVFHPEGFEGTVKAVNPHTGKIVVLWAASPTRAFMLTTDSYSYVLLASSNGCLMGHCVGDTVMHSQGHRGVVKAVNKYREEVVVLWTSGPTGGFMLSTGSYDPRSLSSAEYCVDYTNSQRRQEYYIPRSNGYVDGYYLEDYGYSYWVAY